VSVSANGIDLSSILPDGLSACLSVLKVYCGKTAEWIQMPFGMVSGVGRGMGVLDWSPCAPKGRAVWGESGGSPHLFH